MYLLVVQEKIYPFRIKKEYIGQEPIYFALNDPAERYTLLCRKLTSYEMEKDCDKVSYLFDTVAGKERLPCLLLLKVSSIDDADDIVSSYRKAFDEVTRMEDKRLPTKRSRM